MQLRDALTGMLTRRAFSRALHPLCVCNPLLRLAAWHWSKAKYGHGCAPELPMITAVSRRSKGPGGLVGGSRAHLKPAAAGGAIPRLPGSGGPQRVPPRHLFLQGSLGVPPLRWRPLCGPTAAIVDVVIIGEVLEDSNLGMVVVLAQCALPLVEVDERLENVVFGPPVIRAEVRQRKVWW